MTKYFAGEVTAFVSDDTETMEGCFGAKSNYTDRELPSLQNKYIWREYWEPKSLHQLQELYYYR